MIKCVCCSNPKFYKYIDLGKYCVLRCTNCGQGVTYPFGLQKRLLEHNRERYTLDKRIKLYYTHFWAYNKKYIQDYFKISKYKPSGLLIDVGANIGLFAKTMKDFGYHVECVEINDECRKFCECVFSIKSYKFLEDVKNKYDIITIFDVLEHIPDPTAFIKNVKKLMKPNSILVIQVPNLDSKMARICGKHWYWFDPPEHFHHFCCTTIEIFLHKMGFEILELFTLDYKEEMYQNILQKLGLLNRYTSYFLRGISKFFEWGYEKRQDRKGGLIFLIAKLK